MKRIAETKRLILRRAEPRDADSLLAIRSSEYVMKYNAMKPLGREGLLKNIREDAASDRALYLEHKETGELLGAVWLEADSLRYGVGSLMLSYYLGEQYAGAGYMTEALESAMDYAFEALGVELLSARVFVGNEGSARLLRKLGFVQEGVIRRCVKAHGGIVYDDMLFSILREEYEARKNG